MKSRTANIRVDCAVKHSGYLSILLLFLFIFSIDTHAQISPGDLTTAHSNLEGLSNCIKCHEVGKKVTSEKCLDCHKEIGNLIKENKGYHSSLEVKAKECFSCHNEHHGRNFEIIRFDTTNFEHHNAGYDLKGKHNTLSCNSCHKTGFIKVKNSQKTSFSYLGLKTDCLNCHADYHQKTLSKDCSVCHDFTAFKPARGFDHRKTKFPLKGKHQSVDCVKCHKIADQNGAKFQKFSGISFAACTDCHKDIHENKFGQDCKKCHNEESFRNVTGLKTFDHNKTDYPLEGKHLSVDCKSCHKQSLTAKLKFQRCTDCHKDYHKGQLSKTGIVTDCKDCHSLSGFVNADFSVERHNQGEFRLEGSHLATPCFACHKKGADWIFKDLKKECVDCHENIHQKFMDEKYIRNQSCKSCHTVVTWNQVVFDHNTTDFKLVGKHAKVNCKQCHFREDPNGIVQQRFSDLTGRCLVCHTDIHANQFDTRENTSCTRCHGYEGWKPVQFNHDSSRFKLDGSHKDVACNKCHKEIADGTVKYIQYKFEDITCLSCHLR